MRLWRRFRPTARLRLTLIYSLLFILLSAALLALTYGLVSHATAAELQYRFEPVPAKPGGGTLLVVEGPRGLVVTRPAPGLPVPNGVVRQSLQVVAGQQKALDLHQLLIYSGVAMAVMVVAAVVLGWFAAGRVLRPLRLMTAAARRISAQNLYERLAVLGPDDEFKELGDTLDDLLGRLESAFEAQRRFVANASHELRTPLTLERTLLQVALRDPKATSQELRAACEEVLALEAQHEHLIDALLTLASSERGLEEREALNLAVLAAKVLELRQGDILSMNITLRTNLKASWTLGDTNLVERMIGNLVDNAIRYNVAHGQIHISTGHEEGKAYFAIRNTGLVVPADAVERLLQPFQRLESAKTNQLDGHGLGLSIVRAIAVAHGAELAVQALPSGGLNVKAVFLYHDGQTGTS